MALEEINKIKNRVLDHFKNDSVFIYIFGSITDEKKFNNHSDIDIAIYLKDIPPNFSTFDYAKDFHMEMEREVDFIILNKADIIITMQVLTNGELLYSNDEKFLISFKAKKTSEYIEFKESRKSLEEKLTGK